MFRFTAIRRSKRYDHTMIQTIFIHKNVSTCDFLRFDTNEEGNFEAAQKVEKVDFYITFSNSENSKKFLKCRIASY